MIKHFQYNDRLKKKVQSIFLSKMLNYPNKNKVTLYLMIIDRTKSFEYNEPFFPTIFLLQHF